MILLEFGYNLFLGINIEICDKEISISHPGCNPKIQWPILLFPVNRAQSSCCCHHAAKRAEAGLEYMCVFTVRGRKPGKAAGCSPNIRLPLKLVE